MIANANRIAGLYVLTDPAAGDREALLQRVAAVLAGGAALIQYRDKTQDQARRQQEARAIRELCRRYGALFIVNDDVELAAEVDADGVHLGRDDAGVAQARAVLGPARVIGVSCYDSLARAEQAAAAGADYVAFGSMYPSATKPHAVRASLGLLGEAKRRQGLPVVAIGGITPDNAAAVIAAGADAVAVVGSVFLATDPEREARRLAALFTDQPC